MSSTPKPLGRKAYGHIGHLPQSRMGPGDHKVHEGQARICCERPRDRHDRVIVEEKLDGSCCAVAKIGGEVIPLGRAGYRAVSSPHRQHHLFHVWVMTHWDRFDAALREGERFVGEWLAQAHGTRYELPHEPFVIFDLMQDGVRLPFDESRARALGAGFAVPSVLSDGAPLPVATAIAAIRVSGHGALDPVEGAVWRVERRGVFDFLAKYVRPDKVDGSYLPEESGGPAIWNWLPGAAEVPAKIRAPWDPEQVAALNDFQALGFLHPYTCGSGCGVLVATAAGWVCPCGYTQNWAWAASANRSHPIWGNPFHPLAGGS